MDKTDHYRPLCRSCRKIADHDKRTDHTYLVYEVGSGCEICHKENQETVDHRRRIRKGDESFTTKELRDLRAKYDGLCAYGTLFDLHEDRPGDEVGHVLPLSRGGGNTIENILPICQPCNRGPGGQHSKTLGEWLGMTIPDIVTLSTEEISDLDDN